MLAKDVLLSVGSVAPIVEVFTLGGRGMKRRIVRDNGVQEPQYERMFFILILLVEILFLLRFIFGMVLRLRKYTMITHDE